MLTTIQEQAQLAVVLVHVTGAKGDMSFAVALDYCRKHKTHHFHGASGECDLYPTRRSHHDASEIGLQIVGETLTKVFYESFKDIVRDSRWDTLEKLSLRYNVDIEEIQFWGSP